MANGGAARARLSDWTDGNLEVQGYRFNGEQARGLRLGLRFPTALCLALVVIGLLTRSAPVVLALVPIGAIAGWTPRHPFDLLWNRVVRRAAGGPELPPNPARRRHAFKLATVWLLVVGLLLVAGDEVVALALGGLLIGVCALVTVTNFCIPSTLLAAWGRWRGVNAAAI